MHRLFVALRPPPPIRAALLALQEGVPDARWQDDGQLHVTLRFVGTVDRRQAEDVVAALDAIRAPAPRLRLDGMTAAPRCLRAKRSARGAGPAGPSGPHACA